MKPESLSEQLTLKNTVLGVQFLFVAFGATVLVPLLVGIDPSVALFTAGIGTLIFHLVTKGQVPVFLGSSFAFIAPIENFIEKPGLHRTLLGDGIATAVAGIFGGVPNTTYSEVTGAITLTKVTNPFILRIVAITAIVFALVGKISGLLKTIPQSILGGIGLAATTGIILNLILPKTKKENL